MTLPRNAALKVGFLLILSAILSWLLPDNQRATNVLVSGLWGVVGPIGGITIACATIFLTQVDIVYRNAVRAYRQRRPLTSDAEKMLQQSINDSVSHVRDNVVIVVAATATSFVSMILLHSDLAWPSQSNWMPTKHGVFAFLSISSVLISLLAVLDTIGAMFGMRDVNNEANG